MATPRALADQLWDWLAMIDDWGGASVEVLDEGRRCVDSQVMINRS